jgi:hypothetical protein
LIQLAKAKLLQFKTNKASKRGMAYAQTSVDEPKLKMIEKTSKVGQRMIGQT